MANSNEKMSTSAMAAELVGILVILLSGMALVFILSINVLSINEASGAFIWPFLLGTIGGSLLGFRLFHPKKWADTEAELRVVMLGTFGGLFLVMLGSFFDIEPVFILQSLSFILGITFGAILIIGIRSLVQIQDWSEAEKQKEKKDSKHPDKANLSEDKRNGSAI